MASQPSVTARTRPFGKRAAGAVALSSSGWSFDGVMRRVLGFSRVPPAPHAGPSQRRARSKLAASEPTFEALNFFVRSLDAEMKDKLQTVMRAGREAQTLPAAHADFTRDKVATDGAGLDLFGAGAASLQELQRGHAVACATGFDLEAKWARWGSAAESGSLDARVWLRFGRELALSDPEEWSCLAVVDTRDQVEKLYLRRGERCWWSFDLLIDRPSAQEVQRRRTARGAGYGKVISLPLLAALGRQCRGDRVAARRAARALSARLGFCHQSSDQAQRTA